MKKTICLLSSAILLTCAALSFAAEWGSLKGKFLYEGTPPAPVRATVTKDLAVCGDRGLVQEDLVVGKDGGIANVIVFIYQGLGDAAPPVHPDYAESAEAVVELDNHGCRFEPHVALLRTTQTLVIKNSDPIGHNTKVNSFEKPINPSIPAGKELEEQFKVAERMPAGVSCSIHPWMNAWVVIKDHPYMAASAKDGTFEIKNLPAGEWTFQVWQEKAGYVQDVKVGGKTTKWARGRVTVTIKPGETADLGEVKIAPSAFAK